MKLQVLHDFYTLHIFFKPPGCTIQACQIKITYLCLYPSVLQGPFFTKAAAKRKNTSSQRFSPQVPVTMPRFREGQGSRADHKIMFHAPGSIRRRNPGPTVDPRDQAKSLALAFFPDSLLKKLGTFQAANLVVFWGKSMGPPKGKPVNQKLCHSHDQPTSISRRKYLRCFPRCCHNRTQINQQKYHSKPLEGKKHQLDMFPFLPPTWLPSCWTSIKRLIFSLSRLRLKKKGFGSQAPPELREDPFFCVSFF